MGSMPTKATAPISSLQMSGATPKATFEERRAVAAPGDVFLAPDQGQIAVVVQLPAGEPGVILVPMDGSAPPWRVVELVEGMLPNNWVLHRLDHTKFEFNPTPKL